MKLDNRLTIVLAVLIVLVVAAGGWFLGVSPQLTAAQESETQTAGIEAQSQQTQVKLASLAKQQAQLATTKQTLASLEESVPQTLSGSALLRSMQDLAASTGVTLIAFSPSPATAYTPPAGSAAAGAATGSAATGAATTASASATPTPTPSASATAATPSDPAVYTDPQITATNFLILKFTVQVTGSSDQMTAFLRALQTGSRLVLVTTVSITPSTSGSSAALTVGGNAYAVAPAGTVLTTTTGTAG